MGCQKIFPQKTVHPSNNPTAILSALACQNSHRRKAQSFLRISFLSSGIQPPTVSFVQNRTPTTINSVFNRLLFWDGRAKDSVLGNLSNFPGKGLRDTTWDDRIHQAFISTWWNWDVAVNGYTLMEENLSLFWSLAIRESLSTQRSDSGLQAATPFNHPEIFVPYGHLGNSTTVQVATDGKAADILLQIPAVGAAGGPSISTQNVEVIHGAGTDPHLSSPVPTGHGSGNNSDQ